MKKKIRQKRKQTEMPKVLSEWLYVSAGEPALRSIYAYLREEKKQDVQLWEEAGVLEIRLLEGGTVDLEVLGEEQWDAELMAYMKEQQADHVCTVTFMEEDQALADVLMEELVQRAGGVFCKDTEGFLPEIKRR